MRSQLKPILLLSFFGVAACGDGGSTSASARQLSVETRTADGKEVATIDYKVAHVSTVPANAEQTIQLSVRERFRVRGHEWEHRPRQAVLLIGGNSIAARAIFDLDFQDYDWATYVAQTGLDVFMMEFQGFGLSPRPQMDDPCNVSTAQQQSLLIPNPLSATCSPSYPHTLTTIQSDWDEMDTVVDFIRNLRGVDRVSFIGNSLGGIRIGGYAARHPEKVDRVVLQGPAYFRLPANHPANLPPAVIPAAGFPMTLQTLDTLRATLWDAGVTCAGQVDPAARDAAWSAILDNDPIGRTWGLSGVSRVRTTQLWGWTSEAAFTAPTLVIVGQTDTAVGGQPQMLYTDLAAPSKVFVTVQCASHLMSWEMQREFLFKASAQWIRTGEFQNATNGTFFVDASGNVSPTP